MIFRASLLLSVLIVACGPAPDDGSAPDAASNGDAAVLGDAPADTAVDGGVADDSGSGPADAAPPPGSFAHEPAGYAPIFRYVADWLPAGNPSVLANLEAPPGNADPRNRGKAQYSPSYPAISLTTTNDPTLLSGPSLLRTTCPTGHKSGTGMTYFAAWGDGPTKPLAQTYLKEMYAAYVVKIGDTDFEIGDDGMKFGFFGVEKPIYAGNSVWNEGVFFLKNGLNPPTQQVLPDLKIELRMQSVASTQVTGGQNPRGQNKNGGRLIKTGQFNLLEFQLVLNDPTKSDGIYRAWVNGTLVAEWTNVTYISAASGAGVNGFHGWVFNNTWNSKTDRTRTDYLYFDDVYVSGVPQ